MIVDFLASLSFYIIPYLTGRFFTKKPVNAWIFGSLIWFVFFFIFSFIASLVKLNIFPNLVLGFAIGISLVSIIKNLRMPRAFCCRNYWVVFLLAFSLVIYFLIWKRYTPYPLELNWDIYEHITLANLLSDGKFSFLTTRISDTFTFNSYSPIFGVLLSIPKIIFNRNLIGIYWWLEYWNFLLVVLVTSLLAFKLFNNKLVALFAGLVSALAFESIVSYSPLFLIPQTLVALVTILVFKDLEEENPKTLAPIFLFLFLLHYIVGLLCIAVLGAWYLLQKKDFSKFINKILIAAFIILTVSVLLNLVGNWEPVKLEEASHFKFVLSQKLDFLGNWYGLGLLIPFLVGVIQLLKRNSQHSKLLISLTVLILGVSLAPVSYFLKFYALGGYFVNIIVGVGLAYLLVGLPKLLKILGFAFVLSSMILVFYRNQLTYKEPLHFQGLETQISKEELNAGLWLSKNEKGGFLISDPGTQYILEAASGLNSQGGVYMSAKSRADLALINNSYDYNLIRTKLLEIHDSLGGEDNNKIFVVSGRYLEWQKFPGNQKASSFYNVWSPKLIKDSDIQYIEFLKNSPYLKLIFQNDEMVIFKIL